MSKTAILLDFLITLGNIKGTGITAYAAMTEDQKQAILNRAHNVRSEREMHDLVASLAHHTM